MNKQQNYCFCTLAVGEKYRKLALLLAKDIDKYAPRIKFVVLTDKSNFFQNQKNIIAKQYTPISIKLYNDKRLVIEESLKIFNSCIFIDADMRIIDTVPEQINFLEGIVAYSCYSIIKHNTRKESSKKEKQKSRLNHIQKICKLLNLKIESIKFINEFFFYVTKSENTEEFLRYWQLLAEYFESQGFYDGEGNIIGVAAAKANFNVIYDHEKKIKVFKDRVEIYNKQQGKETIDNLEYYLSIQRNIEYQQKTLWNKVVDKLNNKRIQYTRKLYLRFKLFKNKNYIVNQMKNIND
ncbi:MAG: hypothetical protein ACXITR_07520 [Cyanobacterium sp.]